MEKIICPNCNKPTKIQIGMITQTLVNSPIIRDENGNYLCEALNDRSTEYICLECGLKFIITEKV